MGTGSTVWAHTAPSPAVRPGAVCYASSTHCLSLPHHFQSPTLRTLWTPQFLLTLHSSNLLGCFCFFFPALLPAWKIDFCPLHCHRKHWHRSADKDLLNKDSSFHWTEGEQLRHQVMFLSLLSFGEASLTEENAILSEFVLGVLCQSPGRISSSLILHTYVFCKERFQPSISLSS